MKKLLLLLILWSACAVAQMSSTGPITASGTTCGTTGACISLTLFNSPTLSTTTATIALSNTFSGTIQFEGTSDNVNWTALPGIPLAGGNAASSATATGTWTFGIGALNGIRARASAFASGTATVLIQASAGSGETTAAGVSALFGGPGTSAQYLAANGTLQTAGTTAHGVAGALLCAATSASGTAYICATSPTFTPVDGDIILFQADVASAASPTLSVNATSGALQKNLNGALVAVVANDLVAGGDYLAEYDGANWQVQGNLGTALYQASAVATLPGAGATTVNGQTCTLGSSCAIVLSAENAQTSTYQVLASDFSGYKTILVASGTFTITLVASGTQPAAGQYIKVINYGGGVVTIARSGQNINGSTTSLTLQIPTNSVNPTAAYVESDGTNYFAYLAAVNAVSLQGKNWAAPAALGATTPAAVTATVTTSGTAGTTPGYVDLGAGFTTAAMTPQSSATCTNITGMTWNVAASKNYVGHCQIPMTFAASATVAFCLGGPGTPAAGGYNLNAVGSIGLTAAYDDISAVGAAAYGTKTAASGAVGVSTTIVLVDFFVQNGTTASGTALTLQTAGNGTNTFTVGANAACQIEQVN